MSKHDVVTDGASISRVLEKFNGSPVGVDLETTALLPFKGKVRLVSLSFADGSIYVLDLFKIPPVEAQKVFMALNQGSEIKILQNAKFDYGWLKYHHGVDMWPIFDTYRASNLIYNGDKAVSGHGLWDLFERELGVKPSGNDQQVSDWSAPELSDDQYGYAAEDVEHLHRLRTVLKEKLKKGGLFRAAAIEFGVIKAEAEITNTGFRLDSEKWLKLFESNREAKKVAHAKLITVAPNITGQECFPGMAGVGLNFDSSVQVKEMLEALGIKVPNTQFSTLMGVVEKHPFIQALVDYRKVSKRCSSFGPAYLDNIEPFTGRLHPGYYPFTDAGRYSCTGPALHQVPRTKDYRSCFRTEEGRLLVGADYSGVELRIVAEVSGDETMIQAFVDGADIHRNTAALLASIGREDVTPAQRQQAKAINFGLCYGMGPKKFVVYAKSNYGVTLTLSEAQESHRKFFSAYNGIARWHQRQLRDSKRSRELRTLSGRSRKFYPDEQYNEAFNTPVQGTGADALKTALAEVDRRLEASAVDAKIVHHVHDEILVECPDTPQDVEEVKAIVQGSMKGALEKFLARVPVVVDPSSGRSWADLK